MIKGVRMNKQISLKEWFVKYSVSSQLMSTEIAINRAIEHEQLKHELKWMV